MNDAVKWLECHPDSPWNLKYTEIVFESPNAMYPDLMHLFTHPPASAMGRARQPIFQLKSDNDPAASMWWNPDTPEDWDEFYD